jgi:hypothetical protein
MRELIDEWIEQRCENSQRRCHSGEAAKIIWDEGTREQYSNEDIARVRALNKCPG